MPFHQRTVEPRRVSRLSARDGWTPREESGKRKLRRPVLFSSSDEVSCHTLTSIIYQLSDLSRHASDIFLGIEMEAGLVFRRSCRIQGRLRVLQSEVWRLDPKKTKIHESHTGGEVREGRRRTEAEREGGSLEFMADDELGFIQRREWKLMDTQTDISAQFPLTTS
ncbi:unnamed protein product [Menidia menidia]|uniref:(Atlantic silverside) hypothetical protein n=1 Tax=Menidia menidia TaxID=238744 RepID=A0A8S4B7B8_9TELE|nr:unnamed protein product [Menidia menidia]